MQAVAGGGRVGRGRVEKLVAGDGGTVHQPWQRPMEERGPDHDPREGAPRVSYDAEPLNHKDARLGRRLRRMVEEGQ